MKPRPRLQEDFAYHAPLLKKVASPGEKFLQAVLVAVVGTGLGIGVGVFLAGQTLPANASAAVNSTSAAGTVSAHAMVTRQAKAVTAPVVSANAPAEIQAPVAKESSVAKDALVIDRAATTQIRQPRLVSASLTGVRIGFRHRHGLRHRAALALIGFPKLKTAPPVEEAKLEIPDGRFRFTIEGDQNAVAYDAQTGVVSTDGAGAFVVEKAPGDATTVRSDETPSNVHYKCDQDDNCSLIMASVVVPHARMRTVSQANDWAFVPPATDGQVRDTTQAPVFFGQVSR
jgi:hypothetical protein